MLVIAISALVAVAILAITPVVAVGIPQLRRSRRGWTSLIMLAMVASAFTASGLAGDETYFVGSCDHFVTTVKTSEPSYTSGQTVIITVTQANDGPACTIPPQPCEPPQAFASAYNPAGKDVWDADAHKRFPTTHITCPGPGPVPPMMWTAYESLAQKLEWNQDDCREGIGLAGQANPGCPATHVPAGTYRITGEFYWSDGRFGVHGPPASASITVNRKTSNCNPAHQDVQTSPRVIREERL